MTHMTIKKTMLESISRFKSGKGDLLRAQGMTMAVWAACLCPLLFLLNASLRPLALLCPLMLIFIALPMRQSTAEAMQLFLSGRADGDGGDAAAERLLEEGCAFAADDGTDAAVAAAVCGAGGADAV